MTNIFVQFLIALFATLGFAVIFRVPRRHIPACVLVGALGWVTYQLTFAAWESPVLGCFAGACAVGLLSAICARVFKEATTIFIIPGILCLVPGSNIFKTMEAVLNHNVDNAGEIGIQTLMMAGAIAMGLLVMGAILGIIKRLVSKTVTLKDKF